MITAPWSMTYEQCAEFPAVVGRALLQAACTIAKAVGVWPSFQAPAIEADQGAIAMHNSKALPVARVRSILLAMLRSTGYSHYRHQTAYDMTIEEMCFYDVHCVVTTAMNIFFNMVPTVIDPGRLSMEHLPLEVRLAAMASLTVALKFENEVEETPSTTAMDTVLYNCEFHVHRSRQRAIAAIEHYESVVLQHASVFRCTEENHHRFALCHVSNLCDSGVIEAPRSLCAIRLVTFIVLNSFCETSTLRFTYSSQTIGAAIGVAAVACSFVSSCRPKLFNSLGSREELALARTLLVSIAAADRETRFDMFATNGSWLSNAVSIDGLRSAARTLMEILV